MRSHSQLPFQIRHEYKVYVVPKLWRACIIGNDLIRKHNLQIDGGRQYAYFRRRQGTMRKQHLEEDTRMKQVNYILLAAEQVKIPPFHVFNIQVKLNKPFPKVEERREQDEYEVISIKHTPRAANEIITPSTCMALQVANLTNKKIVVHTNQPLAKMTRLNEIQINTIQQGKQQPFTDNVLVLAHIFRGQVMSLMLRDRTKKKMTFVGLEPTPPAIRPVVLSQLD